MSTAEMKEVVLKQLEEADENNSCHDGRFSDWRRCHQL